MKKSTGLGVYRAVLVLLGIAQLWLTTNYVRQEEFKKLHEDVYDIKTTLKLMQSQETELKDHEDRLRRLERNKTEWPH